MSLFSWKERVKEWVIKSEWERVSKRDREREREKVRKKRKKKLSLKLTFIA